MYDETVLESPWSLLVFLSGAVRADGHCVRYLEVRDILPDWPPGILPDVEAFPFMQRAH